MKENEPFIIERRYSGVQAWNETIPVPANLKGKRAALYLQTFWKTGGAGYVRVDGESRHTFYTGDAPLFATSYTDCGTQLSGMTTSNPIDLQSPIDTIRISGNGSSGSTDIFVRVVVHPFHRTM